MRWSKKVESNYQELFDLCKTRQSRVRFVTKSAAKAIKYKKRYVEVANEIGCPWEFIAAIHMRESNAHFGGVLHNGERIIGTGKKTRLVPRGKGPFDTWQEAAVHALKMKKLHLIKEWSDGRVCYELERYNGWGYQGRNKSKRSPYLWAGSNLQKAGKYIADGKYSSKAWDKQLGAIPVLKKIRQLDKPTKEIVKTSRRLNTYSKIRGFIKWLGLGSLVSFGTLEQISDFATDWRTLTILATGVIVFALFKYTEWMSIKEYKEGRYEPNSEYEENEASEDFEIDYE